MKTNILDFNQRVAMSMELDVKDLHILAWIKDFWPAMTKKIIDGEEYGWVNYDYLNKDLPILKITTANGLYKRLQLLVEIGLLKHKGVKDKKGSFSYYKITNKIVDLLRDKALRGGSDESIDGGSDGNHDRSDKKQDRVMTKVSTKDPSTNNPPTTLSQHISFEAAEEFWKELKERENYEFEVDLKKIVDFINDEEKLKSSPKNIIKKLVIKPENQISQSVITQPKVESEKEKLEKLRRFEFQNSEDAAQIMTTIKQYYDEDDKAIFQKWLGVLKPFDFNHENLILAAPDQFFRDWIDREYLETKDKSKSLMQALNMRYKKVSIVVATVKNNIKIN